jgi:ribosomal-protein-alanine N-acetyltransferase
MLIHNYEDGLVTERLYTRFLSFDDIEPWSKFFEDKEAIEYFPWVANVSDEERSKDWIEKQILHYKEQRGGLQALINKNTHEFIGQCGFLLQEIDGKKEVEVGYHILKKYWGQGYAPEAAKAFFDYGFNVQKTSSIISIIDIKNTKSQRVAEKNGLVRGKQVRWNEMEVFIYRIEKPLNDINTRRISVTIEILHSLG